MKKTVRILLLAVAASALLAGSAMAGQEYLSSPMAKMTGTTGSGFPKGKFYSLNIIAKKGNFHCGKPAKPTGTGNTIFVPDQAKHILIDLESGADVTATKLKVTDSCADAFDGTPAVVQLPPRENGYKVFARPVGRPGGTLQIVPDLVSVDTGSGTQATVADSGFTMAAFSMGRNKGKPVVYDLSDLFSWSGDVCDTDPNFCATGDTCTDQTLCCTDTNADGTLDSCTVMTDTCADGTTQVPGYCKSFTDASVFSTGASVTTMWDMNDNGLQTLEVRFYPQ